MGAKINYTKLIEDRKEIKERTTKLVENKLNYLRSVGRSVMNKTHGGDSWKTTDLSYLGDLGFFLTHSTTLVEIEENGVILHNDNFKNRRPNGEIRLARKYVHMSDRDFAKEIRRAVKERKAYLKKVEVMNAESNLKQAKTKLEAQLAEVEKLEKLVKIAKDLQAKSEPSKP